MDAAARVRAAAFWEMRPEIGGFFREITARAPEASPVGLELVFPAIGVASRAQ